MVLVLVLCVKILNLFKLNNYYRIKNNYKDRDKNNEQKMKNIYVSDMFS